MWVVGRYNGERAKSVIAHAHHGIGYLILEEAGSHHNPTVLVAFRYLGPLPLPEHLEEVRSEYKIVEYEKRRMERQGIRPDEVSA